MSRRAYYSANIKSFLYSTTESIVGELANHHPQDLVYEQTSAWREQIEILQNQLKNFTDGHICFELLIPRMGKRADVIFIIKGLIFVFEFKVGESNYKKSDLRQAQSYALDLSCFHEESHHRIIIPILIATKAEAEKFLFKRHEVNVADPIKANCENIKSIINTCITAYPLQLNLDPIIWLSASYKPTPTIIEAAQALYANHSVEDIARKGATNLKETCEKLNEIIHQARVTRRKTICFVTGVPGAGKTLAGLQIATSHNNPSDEEHAVFLSGNGPLVEVLREALAKDKTKRNKNVSIGDARRETSSFIQNIHHFRDEALKDNNRKPIEKVVIFDEAQRAWNKNKASEFMRKRGQYNFDQSEPEFLISVMNRHTDWCVIIALIGGGQEINDGEAGLNGWFSAFNKNFHDWKIYYSEALKQKEYAGTDVDIDLLNGTDFHQEESLHLATSTRSFRADKMSHVIHYIIHNQADAANMIYESIKDNYPINITRDIEKAKSWVRSKVKGNESSGLIASSGARRLKAEGIFVTSKIEAKDWFLNDVEDVRSCHFLEDVATEFLVQGLELDWCIVGWDADYRFNGKEFEHWKFSGSKWARVNKEENKRYLENSYRVLLTRARQGMVIYIPSGSDQDNTRPPDFYNKTYSYLKSCGLIELP